MSQRVEYLLSRVATTIGEAKRDEYARSLLNPEDATRSIPEGKAMKAILEDVVATYGEDTAREILRPCGHRCIGESVIQKAKDIHQATHSLPEFLDAMNAQHIGGGHLHLEGDAIVVIYDHCYCGTAKNTKNMPPIYCECSAGWCERLFSEVFGKPVRVTIRSTVLRQDPHCAFEVTAY